MVDARRPATLGDDHRCVPRDSVDALLASWAQRRPDLDFSPVGVISRLARLRAHLDDELEGVFDAFGLSPANFAVIVTLARIDDARGVSQRRLMDELGLTSGTISVRIDRLVEQGLVERRPDPDVRRNTLITLTGAGRDLFERMAPAHLANERRLLSALTDDDREALESLLRKLLVEFEGSLPPDGATVHLGMAVAPAHITMAMRASVGLHPSAALLVRSVADDGAAAHAGLRAGDVLLRAGRRDLRSVSALYAAIDDAAPAGRLRLRILRGAAEHQVTVPLADGPRLDGSLAATAGRSARGEHVL